MEFRAFLCFLFMRPQGPPVSLRVLLTNPCIELLHLAYHENRHDDGRADIGHGPA